MYHSKIQIAGLYVDISSFYAYTPHACRDYTVSAPWTDFSVYATRAQIEEKIRRFSVPLSPEMAECICLHEAIALRLWRYDAFVLHSCVLTCGGRCYAIVAPRGVGKTTHAALWKAQFGKEVAIINGDKPIVRRQTDGRFVAYGTPWCGKEGENRPVGVPLDALCLLSRGAENTVSLPDSKAYLDSFIGQVVFPAKEPGMSRGAWLLADFIRHVPAVQVAVNRQPDAARIVRRALDNLSYRNSNSNQ